MPAPVRVFVSYSRLDEKWLEELKVVLAPLIREDRLTFWNDRDIPPGTNWATEIEGHLRSANAAILLVTANFLNSPYIVNKELPVILERAQNNTLRLLWIAVGSSMFRETPLNNFQAVNDPKHPLDQFDHPRRMQEWVKIGERIKEAVGVSAVAGALAVVDESYNMVRSVVLGPATEPQHHPVAQYSARNDKVEFVALGTTVTITADDMKLLDKDSLELIQMYEDSMKQRFDRIKKIYPSRVLPNGEIDDEVDRQLRSLAKPMCQDLNRIIDFLATMGKFLHDHYHRYRQLCHDLNSSSGG